jgi:hypothetical protein
VSMVCVCVTECACVRAHMHVSVWLPSYEVCRQCQYGFPSPTPFDTGILAGATGGDDGPLRRMRVKEEVE